MDPMTDEVALASGGGSGAAAPGAMRVVMLNARTAVLVPADAPDPVAADPEATDPEEHASDAADAGVAWTDAGDDPDAAGAGAMDDASAEIAPVGDEGLSPATDAPDADAFGADAPGAEPGWAGSADSPASAVDLDDAGTGYSAPAEPDAAEDQSSPEEVGGAGPEEAAPAAAAGSDSRWKAELLARLDDLGRLLARAATPETRPPETPVAVAGPDGAVAALSAALDRLDQRMTEALADVAARLDRLEQVAATHADAAEAPGPDMAEAIADLRMQVRMVEVQVGTLGKLLVSGTATEAPSPEALRTRLAELMASEQRLAAGR